MKFCCFYDDMLVQMISVIYAEVSDIVLYLVTHNHLQLIAFLFKRSNTLYLVVFLSLRTIVDMLAKDFAFRVWF